MYGNPTSISQAQLEQDVMDDYPTLFCKALYDYDAQDASALSFRRDDIIEVLTQQASGWWDGLLGEERGWFPSNYVTIISDEEADMAFSGSDASNVDVLPNGHSSRDSVVDMSHAMMGGSQEENEDWLNGEVNGARGTMDESTTSTWHAATSPSDFWMPQVAPNGQVRLLKYFARTMLIATRYSTSIRRQASSRSTCRRRTTKRYRTPTWLAWHRRRAHGLGQLPASDLDQTVHLRPPTATLTWTGQWQASGCPVVLGRQSRGSRSSRMTGWHTFI